VPNKKPGETITPGLNHLISEKTINEYKEKTRTVNINKKKPTS
jgi:hypothetical protein